MELTSTQKKAIRGQAQTLKSTFQIGKNGLNTTLLTALEDALAAHELVKIHVLNNTTLSKEDVLKQLEASLHPDYLYLIGHQIVVFKVASRQEKRKISAKLLK